MRRQRLYWWTGGACFCVGSLWLANRWTTTVVRELRLAEGTLSAEIIRRMPHYSNDLADRLCLSLGYTGKERLPFHQVHFDVPRSRYRFQLTFDAAQLCINPDLKREDIILIDRAGNRHRGRSLTAPA